MSKLTTTTAQQRNTKNDHGQVIKHNLVMQKLREAEMLLYCGVQYVLTYVLQYFLALKSENCIMQISKKIFKQRFLLECIIIRCQLHTIPYFLRFLDNTLKIALFKKNFFFVKKMASSSHKNIQQSTTKAVLCAARLTKNEKKRYN